MSYKGFYPEAIVPELRQTDVELDKGQNVTAACKLLGMVEATYFRWRLVFRVPRPPLFTGSPRASRYSELKGHRVAAKKL